MADESADEHLADGNLSVGASSGETLALVIHLRPDHAGQWRVSVDGTTVVAARPMPPTGLVVRLWRSPERGILRGTIGLAQDEPRWAPIQTNERLEALLRAWLGEPDEPAPAEPGARP